MISVVYFAERKLPSVRLMTALGLYFDSVTIPLIYLVPDSQFGNIIHSLSSRDRQFVIANTDFISDYKEITPDLFKFYNPMEDGWKSDDIKHREFMRHLQDISKNTSKDPPEGILAFFQYVCALAYHAGVQSAEEEIAMASLTIPFSERDMFGVSPHLSSPDKRFADILASSLAVEAISLSLPDLEAVHPTEILHAREVLGEELVSFRLAMYRLGRNLRDLLKESVSVEKIAAEASFLVKTNIQPALHILKKRIKSERRSFARKIIIRGLGTLRFAINYCLSPDPMKAAQLASEAAKGTLDFSQYCDEVAKLENQAALSYLAKLPQYFQK